MSLTKHQHRTIVGAGALAVVVLALGLAHRLDAPIELTALAHAAPAAPPPPEVDVAPVIARTITDFQRYSGRLQAVDHVDVRPLVSGTIVAVHFKDGAMVKRGDALFTIDPRPYTAALDRAIAQLAAARARQAYAVSDAARAQRLIADNAIAKRDFEQKHNAALEADADVKAADAAVETAKIDLSYTQIKAPISGRVSRAELTLGNIVSTGANAPLLTTVVSVSPIYASFDVDEQTYLQYLSQDARSTATENAVPVRLGLANEEGYSRTGIIDSIDNRLDTRSGTIRVRARFDNADGTLLPGLYARVAVGGGKPHPAVMVSDAAIGTDQDKQYVLVVDKDDKAQYREVHTGSEQDGLRVIKSGLQAGERIVVEGLQRVRPNTPVTVHTVAMLPSGEQPDGAKTHTVAQAQP
ncbi:efflux RND transporter periplasmic adaptor subunit [Robbsia sp. KACC 23696]|uniref:efflux RND transporter periplasmic adaptor subunit n=1 Tax=Robbsia sp. KACC 23696 TaxID=3149231 RepID=UPI00325B40F2